MTDQPRVVSISGHKPSEIEVILAEARRDLSAEKELRELEAECDYAYIWKLINLGLSPDIAVRLTEARILSGA